MNVKWKHKKLTLVVIPDANRAVVRLRIPQLLAYAAAMLAAVSFLVFCSFYLLHRHTLHTAVELQTRLNGASKQWNATLSSKEETIEQLQNEVIQLSQQAQLMKARVEEMRKLEKDIRTLSMLESPQDKKAALAAAAPAGEAEEPFSPGVGGSANPVTQEEIMRLGKQTEASLTALSSQALSLHTSLVAAKQKAEEQRRQLRLTPALWPTATRLVTSDYGYRKDPFTYRPSFHSGIDFGAKKNEPVYATADGTAITTDQDRFRGNYVLLEHADGIRTCYMHLNKILVRKGDRVSQGASIGLVGSTGRSTGPHLHYEVIKNGKSVNPRPYLRMTRKDGV